MARSLAVASALLGAEFVLCAPPATSYPRTSGTDSPNGSRSVPLRLERDPRTAVAGADVVYTDVWASMGQEHEAVRRREAFARYQVNEDLLSLAREDVIFLHCLPAHREEEVTSGVLDGPHSQVLLQAANRLHFQMALLVWLLGDDRA